ncbi:uncharacterized protein BT62DRAFT_992884 [Guyanagaster necrorhizus]|uniref:Pectate lyase C n=1 Tax=Guyanagaster necrorhizus TaxID=856835 RepID=A0A9P7VWQ8_9AGAR|nr:uncharacterized protein BT62DRAFT_992884 [Guyanagaster necrorhizus MCA 3950]KAG7447957.1 hypothetical protein BT62DRAFT_992884 [Guyanagaster necrorhizus MCA 3950]
MFLRRSGAQATGGRGGSVYVVINLNDFGEGSLRDAVSESNRIVVFAVGGFITISDRIVVSNHVTIAEQTSLINCDSGKDAITIANGENMIFGHVSVSWGRAPSTATIIAQGLETHSCGGLIQTDGGVSILRSLYIDNQTRNPKVKGVNDFVNNVVYNWGGGGGYIAGDSAGQSYTNIIGNVFISGPSTSIHPFTSGNENFHAYMSDNYYDPDQDGTSNGWVLSAITDNYSDIDFQTSRYNYPTVVTLLSSSQVLASVSASAGASKVRDRVDTYLIGTELGLLGTQGALISDPTTSPINGPGPIDGGTALTDSDGDGIPDVYESALGTNPNVADSATIASNGYANIKNYFNSLASKTSEADSQ